MRHCCVISEYQGIEEQFLAIIVTLIYADYSLKLYPDRYIGINDHNRVRCGPQKRQPLRLHDFKNIINYSAFAPRGA
jgi:hypothetical protein